MGTLAKIPIQASATAKTIRSKIMASGEHVWKFDDFRELPPAAVAQAFSRLAKQGIVNRIGKGLYYRPRSTPFGASKPSRAQIRQLASQRSTMFPAGVSAANLLGFTTQNAAKVELATDAASLPRLLIGSDAIVHTRRPTAWRQLSQEEAAVLDFLRNRGSLSELSSKDTLERLIRLVGEKGRLQQLLSVAETEPPRVRAMLGAIAQELGASPDELGRLRNTLNPLSSFDFGLLSALKHADQWQAKKGRSK